MLDKLLKISSLFLAVNALLDSKDKRDRERRREAKDDRVDELEKKIKDLEEKLKQHELGDTAHPKT